MWIKYSTCLNHTSNLKWLSIKSVLNCSIYTSYHYRLKSIVHSVHSTAVLVMLCMKSTQFKMLWRMYYTAGKIFFLRNSQLLSQPRYSYLISKDVPGMLSVKETIFSAKHFNPNLQISIGRKILYKQCKTEVNMVKNV